MAVGSVFDWSMKEKLSTRSNQAVQVGQEAMKVMLKEPIKEAVKESLDEEGVVSQDAIREPQESASESESASSEHDSESQSDQDDSESQSDQDDSESQSDQNDSEPESEQDDSSDAGSGLPGLKMVVPAVALVGVALAVRRMGEGSLDTESLQSVLGDDDDTPMEDDMSKSVPSDGGRGEQASDEAAEVDI